MFNFRRIFRKKKWNRNIQAYGVVIFQKRSLMAKSAFYVLCNGRNYQGAWQLKVGTYILFPQLKGNHSVKYRAVVAPRYGLDATYIAQSSRWKTETHQSTIILIRLWKVYSHKTKAKCQKSTLVMSTFSVISIVPWGWMTTLNKENHRFRILHMWSSHNNKFSEASNSPRCSWYQMS